MRRVLLVLLVGVCLLGVLVVTIGPEPRAALVSFTSYARDLTAGLGLGRLSDDDAEGLANVVLFVPLGAAGALLARRYAAWVVIALGVLSLAIEVVQARLPGRTPSYRDVVANSVGALAGAVLVLVLAALWSLLRRSRRTQRPVS